MVRYQGQAGDGPAHGPVRPREAVRVPVAEHPRCQGRGQVAGARARPVAALLRRRVPPPRHARHDRHDPDARRGRGLPRRSRSRQAQPGWSTACSIAPNMSISGRSSGATCSASTPRSSAPRGCWRSISGSASRFAANKPVNRMVDELVTAQGSIFSNGPANFYRVASSPDDLAETTAQVFMGVRLQCAKCHHHPFESYGQDDYYSLAAYFARVRTKRSDEFGLFGGEQVVYVAKAGDVYQPRTGKKMVPRPLGDAPADDPVDRRRALAKWLTVQNPRWLARNVANRYWGYLMGKGLVNPIDDLRETNPPSNPALLDALAGAFIASGYDLKALLRLILTSRVYQLSAMPTPDNRLDTTFFTHYTIKRLTAEQLLDAIDAATGTVEKFPKLPAGTRAIALPDTNYASYFLDTFGRPLRAIACECERSGDPNLSQALHLMNGDLLNRKLIQPDGRLARTAQGPQAHRSGPDRPPLSAHVQPASHRRRDEAGQDDPGGGFQPGRRRPGPVLGLAQLQGVPLQPLIVFAMRGRPAMISTPRTRAASYCTGRKTRVSTTLTAAMAGLLVGFAGQGAPVRASDPPPPSYEQDIKPILVRRCTVCHSVKNQERPRPFGRTGARLVRGDPGRDEASQGGRARAIGRERAGAPALRCGRGSADAAPGRAAAPGAARTDRPLDQRRRTARSPIREDGESPRRDPRAPDETVATRPRAGRGDSHRCQARTEDNECDPGRPAGDHAAGRATARRCVPWLSAATTGYWLWGLMVRSCSGTWSTASPRGSSSEFLVRCTPWRSVAMDGDWPSGPACRRDRAWCGFTPSRTAR